MYKERYELFIFNNISYYIWGKMDKKEDIHYTKKDLLLQAAQGFTQWCELSASILQ
jgi:hypothetical protein